MTSQEISPFDVRPNNDRPSQTRAIRMTQKRQKAALLIAVGDLSWKEIAAVVGVALGSIYEWNRHSIFREEVKRLRAEILDEIKQRGIASKANRLKIYDDLAQSTLSIIEANKKAYGDNPRTPGDDSGLIGERLIDTRGSGVVSEYFYMDKIVSTLQSVLKQAAQELGEWEEKSGVMDVRVLVAKIADIEGLTEDERKMAEASATKYLAQMGS